MSECGAAEDLDEIVSGEDEDEEDLDEQGAGQSTPEKRARHAITGRGVTLHMLMADGIITAGEGLLSLEYLGQKFTADLLPSGKIKSNETGQTFGSPSSWAIFCKKLVNPAKKSGCGWASVKYKGRKLDSWKTSWFRLVKPRKPNISGAQSPARSVTSDMGMSSDGAVSETESRLTDPVPRSESRLTESFPRSESQLTESFPRSESQLTESFPRTDSSTADPLVLHKNDSNVSDLSLPKNSSNISDFPLADSGSVSDGTINRNDSSISDFTLHRSDSSDKTLHRTDSNISDMMLNRNDSNISDMMLNRTDSNISDMMLNRTDSGVSLLRSESGVSLLNSAGAVKTETEKDFAQDCVLDLTTRPKTEGNVSSQRVRTSSTDICFIEEQEEALNLSLKENPAPAKPPGTASVTPTVNVKQEVTSDQSDFSTDRKPVCYSALPERSQKVDQNLLVECEKFAAVNKIQPYTVSMSTNSLLIMDFHCHLTTSEVVGYLGGKWDAGTQHLSIQQAFPCRCRLGDGQNAPLIEEEIRASMKHQSMSLVGWYHSHPYSAPEPSIKDMDCQMSYQLRMKGAKSTYFPCVGLINSPYYGKSLRTESSIQMYMVMPPPETVQSEYGIPMALKYSVKQNHTIGDGLLNEMVRTIRAPDKRKLVEFYRGSPDWISFQHSWHPSITYLEKLTTSLMDKLPEDQTDNSTFLEFVNHILTAKH